jgi:hypothetical protein
MAEERNQAAAERSRRMFRDASKARDQGDERMDYYMCSEFANKEEDMDGEHVSEGKVRSVLVNGFRKFTVIMIDFLVDNIGIIGNI